MRGTGVAIAVAASAGLHVALLTVLDGVETHAAVPVAAPRLALVPAPPPPPVDEPIPIELVVLPAPPTPAPTPVPPAAAPDVAPARAPAPTRGVAADDGLVATTRMEPGATAVEPGPTGEPTGPDLPGEPGVLSMRTPHRFVPLLDPSKVALTVAPPDPSKPLYAPPEPSGQLQPDGGGTYRTVQPGFIGHVAPDGTITFEDQPSAHAHLNIPRPRRIARAVQHGLEDWFADPGAALRAGDADRERPRDDDATEEEKPQHGDQDAAVLPVIGGGFDATDALMRANGMDPYAAAKLKWLDETRAERMEMRRRHRLIELAKSTQNMQRHLARLWARPGLDDAARRAALFELWDDCADTGDAALAEACTRTRAAVIGFIRARLPAGSAAAYSAEELRALNARKLSSVPFAPYD